MNTAGGLEHLSRPGYLPETPRHRVKDPNCVLSGDGGGSHPHHYVDATFTSRCRTGLWSETNSFLGLNNK